jgi:acylphosphatase
MIDMDDGTKRVHLQIHGRVQGVGFRYFVVTSVADLDISGWVRNRFDGSVEVMAEGSKQDLESLIKMVKVGPRSSNVTKVDEAWSGATGEFSRFTVKMDGW